MKKATLYILMLLFSVALPLASQDTPPAQPPTDPFEEIRQEAQSGKTDHFISDFMNMLASLGLIIAFIFIVSWFMKRFLNTRIQQMNTTSPIKIVERRALTPKTSIYLLEIQERSLIIAESTNGVTLLNNSHLKHDNTFSQVMNEKRNDETNRT